MSKQFLSIPYEILAIEGLTPAEKLVLARIAGFNEYFESTTRCAEFIRVQPDTIKKAKCHLEKLGYITALADTGRGKRYKANPIWEEGAKQPEEEKVENTEAAEEKFDPASICVKACEPEKRHTRTRDKFKEYTHYMPAYDMGLKYLSRNGIGIFNATALKRSFMILVDTLAKDLNVNEVIYTFSLYFSYLESEQYLYQLERNKYCPQINTPTDIYDKFVAIRNFKNNPDRQYDPSKVLTN